MSDDVDVEGDAETKSTRTRWRWTGTVGAGVLLLTLCAVVLVYVVRGEAVPIWATATFGLAVLAGVAWTFGESALKAARQTKEGGE